MVNFLIFVLLCAFHLLRYVWLPRKWRKSEEQKIATLYMCFYFSCCGFLRNGGMIWGFTSFSVPGYLVYLSFAPFLFNCCLLIFLLYLPIFFFAFLSLQDISSLVSFNYFVYDRISFLIFFFLKKICAVLAKVFLPNFLS